MAVIAVSNNVTNDLKLRNDLRKPISFPRKTPSEALAAADNSLFYQFAQTLVLGFLDEEGGRTD